MFKKIPQISVLMLRSENVCVSLEIFTCLSLIIESSHLLLFAPILWPDMRTGRNLLWFPAQNVLHRLMCLNPWSLHGGAVWESYGTFRIRDLTGRIRSL